MILGTLHVFLLRGPGVCHIFGAKDDSPPEGSAGNPVELELLNLRS